MTSSGSGSRGNNRDGRSRGGGGGGKAAGRSKGGRYDASGGSSGGSKSGKRSDGGKKAGPGSRSAPGSGRRSDSRRDASEGERGSGGSGGAGRRQDRRGGDQSGSGRSKSADGRRRPERSSRGPSKGSSPGGRIPAPPDLNAPSDGSDEQRWEREEVIIERISDNDTERGDRADGSGRRSKGTKRKRPGRRIHVEEVNMGALGQATASKLRARLAEAAVAFEAERFTEAERLLQSIERLAPDVPEVHELLGLTHYRLGRWRRAIDHLERFQELTRSVEQHPVLADCYRALRQWGRAEELWLELGDASPGPELVEEGRIVQAGTMADRGRLVDAIRFLERAPKVKGKPGVHHLRRWYATADLYERAGDNSRARRLFSEIAVADPNFGDAAERAANL